MNAVHLRLMKSALCISY